MSAAQVGVGHLEKFQESGCNFPRSRPYCLVRRLAVQMAKEPKMNNSKFIGLLLLVAMGLQGCVAKPGGDAVSSASSLPAASPTYTEATCPDFCVSEERIVLIGETNSSLSKEIDVWSKSGGQITLKFYGGGLASLKKISNIHWKLTYKADTTKNRKYGESIFLNRSLGLPNSTYLDALTVDFDVDVYRPIAVSPTPSFINTFKKLSTLDFLKSKDSLVSGFKKDVSQFFKEDVSGYYGNTFCRVYGTGAWKIVDADPRLVFSRSEGRGDGGFYLSLAPDAVFLESADLAFSILDVDRGVVTKESVYVSANNYWSLVRSDFNLDVISQPKDFSMTIGFRLNVVDEDFNRANPLLWRIVSIPDGFVVDKTSGAFGKDDAVLSPKGSLEAAGDYGSVSYEVINPLTSEVYDRLLLSFDVLSKKPIFYSSLELNQWPAGEPYAKWVNIVNLSSIPEREEVIPVTLARKDSNDLLPAHVKSESLQFTANTPGVYKVQPWPFDVVRSPELKILPYEPVAASVNVRDNLVKKSRYQFSSQHLIELDVSGQMRVLKPGEAGWVTVGECESPSGEAIVDIESADDHMWVITEKEILNFKYDNGFCEWRQRVTDHPSTLLSIDRYSDNPGTTYFVNDALPYIEFSSQKLIKTFAVWGHGRNGLLESYITREEGRSRTKLSLEGSSTREQLSTLEDLARSPQLLEAKFSLGNAVSRDGKAVWRLFKDGDSIWLNEYVASDLLAGVIKPKRYAPTLTTEQKAAIASLPGEVNHASIQFLPQKQAIVVGLNRLIWTLDLRPAQN